jgi:elongation factor P--(R)-beta-lysine ligase
VTGFLISLEGFPSGQRDQTVNLTAQPSVVRIHLPPPYLATLIFIKVVFFFLLPLYNLPNELLLNKALNITSFKSTLSWNVAQQRAVVLQQIRTFFLKRNVLEVETPSLAGGTVTDVHLDAFQCDYNFSATQDSGKTFYLQTSPEFAMKRLLVSGFGDIYQICKAFRHEEQGRFHNPEFTLLEWYRLGFDHFQLMAEVAELLIYVLACQPPEKITYQQLFIDHVGVDPLNASFSDLAVVLKKYKKLSEWILAEDDRDILLQLILSEIIEPNIGQQRPCFIYNFPSSQASLAKISQDDERVAERFECYFKGIELVNGFHELTSKKEQLTRFQQDNLLRKGKEFQEKPIDYKFLAALEAGLPDCSGVALGVDRLVMLACDLTDISQVISFPIKDA